MNKYGYVKTVIDTHLWYIENFLPQEDLEYLDKEAKNPFGWYKTMRDPSIRNKFLDKEVLDIDENGFLKRIPVDSDKTIVLPNFVKEDGIYERLESVLPEKLVKFSTLQSFLKPEDANNGRVGGAYDWHHEKGNEGMDDNGMTAAWTLYINDDYVGGVLEFLYKPYKIYPKPGMLINIPMTKDFTHRVTPVISGARHTLYGVCYEDVDKRPLSEVENC